MSLGETYSIVTEYTSFLVLENNAEYQRWKIDRRNDRRTTGERDAQARRQRELEALRNQAAADLGPDAVRRSAPAATQTTPSTLSPAQIGLPSPPSATSVPSLRTSNGFDFGIGGGSGPVGPLFVAAAAWLARMRRKGKKDDQ